METTSAPSTGLPDPVSSAWALPVALPAPAAALSHRWAEPGRSDCIASGNSGCVTAEAGSSAVIFKPAPSRLEPRSGPLIRFSTVVRGSAAGCVASVRRSQGVLFNPPEAATVALLVDSWLRRLSAASRRIFRASSKRRDASSALDRRTDAGTLVTCIPCSWRFLQ